MKTVWMILPNIIVIAGSALVVVAPIWKHREKVLRIVGVCFALVGGIFGIQSTLKSAAKMDTLMKNSEEALAYVSGGGSRPEVFPVATQLNGRRGVAFYFDKRGAYPLYDLQVNLAKPHRSPESKTTLLYGPEQASLQYPELQPEISRLMFFAPEPNEESTFYEADMRARNGHWGEVIHLLKTSSGKIVTRWVIYESKNPSVTPNKLILDLADTDFPTEERKRKIYPLLETLP